MIRTVIIDDEQACIDVLLVLLKAHAPQVKVVATGASVDEGIALINELQPELVFLDVELRSELSFTILEKVKSKNFYTIITTAHEKYAIRAIKSSCLEYLLKPVAASDLQAAMAKYEQQKQVLFNQKKIEILLENIGSPAQNISKLAIPCTDGYAFVNASEILYCEADLKYTQLYTTKNERITSSKNLGEFEELLQSHVFFRCHKSFIINLNFIKKFIKSDSQVLMTDGKLIDISTRKKDEFLRLFERA